MLKENRIGFTRKFLILILSIPFFINGTNAFGQSYDPDLNYILEDFEGDFIDTSNYGYIPSNWEVEGSEEVTFNQGFSPHHGNYSLHAQAKYDPEFYTVISNEFQGNPGVKVDLRVQIKTVTSGEAQAVFSATTYTQLNGSTAIDYNERTAFWYSDSSDEWRTITLENVEIPQNGKLPIRLKFAHNTAGGQTDFEVDCISSSLRLQEEIQEEVGKYSIDDLYMQYRTHENESLDYSASWVGLSTNDQPIEEHEIGNIIIKDSIGNEINYFQEWFWFGDYYFYDCITGDCIESGPFFESGFLYRLEEDITPDTYQFEVETVDGQTLTGEIDYPRKLKLPVVSSSSMQSRHENGNLVLYWENPKIHSNWHEVHDLRIILIDNMGNWIVYGAVNRNDESLTIPASTIEKAEALHGTNVVEWQVQTRANNEDGMNYARGVSDMKVLHDPSDGDDNDSSSGCFIRALK